MLCPIGERTKGARPLVPSSEGLERSDKRCEKATTTLSRGCRRVLGMKNARDSLIRIGLAAVVVCAVWYLVVTPCFECG